MLTSTAEDSSEDEDTNIINISQKVKLCQLNMEDPTEDSSLMKLPQETAANKNVFYYPIDDSVEHAQTFDENLSMDDSDPFIEKLRVILEKFPSINLSRIKKVNKINKKYGKEYPDDYQTTSRNINTENTALKSKLKTWNENSISGEGLSSPLNHGCNGRVFNKDIAADDSCMSESIKSKNKNLVKTLYDSDDDSFSYLFLEHKQEFLELLPQIDLIQEVIPQTIKIILKIFSMQHPSKRHILLALMNDEFIDKFVAYITLLPIECEDNLSDSEIEHLFHNILLFCDKIHNELPLKTSGVLRKILLSLQYAVKGFKEVKNCNLNDTLTEKIIELLENSKIQRPTISRKKKLEENENAMEPPDNVKYINIFPTKNDLFEPPKFLRKNVVNGSYRDVNHYLDVQFRLLREDFIAPLRCGLQLYCKSISKGCHNQNQIYDNIRIHEDVKILHGTITDGRLGHLVKLQSNLDFSRNSKRFMFGSLVLFTPDNFESFFCGTIINPAGENLLIVDLCSDEISLTEIYNKTYTMIESEVYFEPYFHVLTALQQFDDSTFPMKEYIVDVKPNDKVTEKHYICPSSFNESQKEAFKSAMAHEFVVIQGPPGTGKTFLAEAITKTILLEKGPICYNSKEVADLTEINSESEWERFWRIKRRCSTKKTRWCVYSDFPEEWLIFHPFFSEDERKDKPILVICFTNHALDQFLGKLLNYTKRLIRVGGQSKNHTVQQYNLKEVRRCWFKEQTFNRRRCNCDDCKRQVRRYNCYLEHITRVQKITYDYLVSLKILEAIVLDGVLKSRYLCPWMSPRLRRILWEQEQFEAWLLEGANVLHIEDEDISDDSKPENNVNTQQLLSEFRQSTRYRDDLEVFDVKTVESRSTAEADDKFFAKSSNLMCQSKNIQKKQRKCRQKGENENMFNMYQNQIEDLENKRRYISNMLARKIPVDLKRIRELNRASNIWEIDFEDRWMLYNYWVQHYQNKIKGTMIYIETILKDEEARFTEERDDFDLQLLKSANVIGMTTTSAARLKTMLEDVGPEIVVVEEAAEVLEAHIVVALNPHVKKVILIGDHKQLRPNPAVFDLARQYQLDVSLFERMINNGLACQVLDTQQRMRPEIASLIAPGIYPDLKNGRKTLYRPNIRGVASNVFFVTHKKFEDEYSGETRSHRNMHEVNFLISLCQYLLQQNYCSSEITILATYLGQMTALENEKRKQNLPADLRVATVDNYQGEENTIILLSLVRSNAEANIGFLSAENRVCVALSRAKDGLYIIGNMDNLTQRSKVWQQVKAQLEAMKAIGPALPLGCRSHKNEKSLVSCSGDFIKVPISGCKLRCGMELECGHVCLVFCHSFDPEHEEDFACQRPCERMACGDHKCPKTCGEKCGVCSTLVERELPCGHFAKLECYKNPEFYSCEEKLTVTLETCGHTVTKFCYEEEAVCLETCSVPTECGHPCTRMCHNNYSSPMYRVDLHGRKYCETEIKKILDCGHTCKILCKDSQSKVICRKPCMKTLLCGHPCDNVCFEPCSEICKTQVEKTLSPCGHQVMLQCSTAAESSQCRKPCPLNLPCGHPCPGTCSADCSQFTCHENVRCEVDPGCGHGLITIPCFLNKTDDPSCGPYSDQLLQHCRAPCRADLPCGHICVGRCGDCMQGRLHVPCSYPCARVLDCGHRCEKGCYDECPAICTHLCTNRCAHQACDQPCGDPCTPCQKMCARRCKHQRCSRKCSEDCDCPPCDERCPLNLECGHPCPGFCGEPCTKFCTECNPDVFLVPGQAYNSGIARYVSLEDCGHPIEENLLRKYIINDRKPNEIIKCPVCGEPIKFVLRFKDHIKQFYFCLAEAKTKEKVKIENFLSRMKSKKYMLKFESDTRLSESYGDHAVIILEHLRSAPLVYKTSMRAFTFFEQLTKTDSYLFKDEPDFWKNILERRKLLLRALSLRVKSMSSSDYNEFATEIFRLERATSRRNMSLLLSLKKYSLDELMALE